MKARGRPTRAESCLALTAVFALGAAPSLAPAAAQTPPPAAPQRGDLHLRVVGLRVSSGEVRAALHRSEEAYDARKRAFRSLTLPVREGVSEGTYEDIPFGTYCIMLFHDENGNGEFDTNLLGAPQEPYGFSNNARVRFAAPSFDAVCFAFDAKRSEIEIDVAHPMARWSIGLGGLYASRPYAGMRFRSIPIPMVNYVGERLTIAGPLVDYELGRLEQVSVSLIGEYRFAGYDPADSDELEGMDQRKDTYELGLALRRRIAGDVVLRAQVTADVLGRHEGFEGELAATRNFRTGRWSLAPSVGVTLQSARLADYYYGVRTSEATPTRPAHDVGTTLNTHVALTTTWRASPNWLLILGTNVELLGGEIRDSPIVEEDLLFNVFVGVVYSL